MKTTLIAVGLFMGVGMVSLTARAEPPVEEAPAGGVRQAVESGIALEERRIVELQKVATTARDTASALEAEARSRDASAADFYARSKEFISAANRLKGTSRARVTSFATAMNVYARTDQEMAGASRNAATILANQAKNATASVEAHRKHIAELRQSLDDWK